MNRPAPDLAEKIRHFSQDIPARPSLERRRLHAYIAMMVADLGLLMSAFVLAGMVYEGVWIEWRASMQGQLLLPIFITIALYNGTYSGRALTDCVFAIRKVLVALAISAALLNFVAFYTKSNATFSRGSFTIGLLFSAVLLAVSRRLVTDVVRRLWNGRIHNQLVIDDGGPRFRLYQAQIVNAADAGIVPGTTDPFMRDRIGRILLNQDKVVVSCPTERREQWAMLLKSSGIQGELVSQPAHQLGAYGVIRYDEQNRTTLVVSTGPLRIRSRAIKRGFDLFIAICGLILLSPLLAWAALRIKLEDGGPVLFTQQRMGRGNRLFDMYKLRTMRVDNLDQDGSSSTLRDDERITRIGRFLRANSMDELPQLWNVIRGDMSIVGPRPHALGSRANEKFFWDVDRHYWKRHSLKPGLTGLAQIRGHRGNTEREQDLTDRLQSDLEYISSWSLQHDIGIVLRTLKVLRHERAY